MARLRIKPPRRRSAAATESPNDSPLTDVTSDVDMNDAVNTLLLAVDSADLDTFTNMHKDDDVEEYAFTSDDEAQDEEDNEHDTAHYKINGKGGDVLKEAIMISSDDDEAKDNEDPSTSFDLTAQSWKNYNASTRRAVEEMYVTIQKKPIGDKGDWDLTEDYQREKDKEMLR